MNHKRKIALICSLTERLFEVIDEGTEMFMEERPHLWERAGITEARKNLAQGKLENDKLKQTILNELERLSKL